MRDAVEFILWFLEFLMVASKVPTQNEIDLKYFILQLGMPSEPASPFLTRLGTHSAVPFLYLLGLSKGFLSFF